MVHPRTFQSYSLTATPQLGLMPRGMGRWSRSQRAPQFSMSSDQDRGEEAQQNGTWRREGRNFWDDKSMRVYFLIYMYVLFIYVCRHIHTCICIYTHIQTHYVHTYISNKLCLNCYCRACSQLLDEKWVLDSDPYVQGLWVSGWESRSVCRALGCPQGDSMNYQRGGRLETWLTP